MNVRPTTIHVSTLMLILACFGPLAFAFFTHIAILESSTRPFHPFDFRLSFMLPLIICLGGAVLNILLIRKKRLDNVIRLGVVINLLGILYFAWFSICTDRADENILIQARHVMESTASDIDDYYIDHGFYPPSVTGADSFNGTLDPRNPVYSMPTFQVTYKPRDRNPELDPYMTHIAPGATYIYFSTEKGFILLSPGMDQDFDIDPVKEFDEIISLPKDTIHPKTYDISNGTYSNGDLIRWGTPKELK